MPPGEHLLRSLLILLSIAVLGPMIAVRIRVPTAVVLILAGLGIGPAGLGLPATRRPSAFCRTSASWC